MPDSAFADPRLAVLYDPLHPERPDLEHYVTIVGELGARSALDLGCGTGTLACLLAARGVEVVGADPAAASLDVARTKAGSDAVRWVHGDARSLPPLEVDIALMTGNVAQVFTSDDEWLATLSSLRSVLRAGGHLVFEVRDPARRGWEEWTRDRSWSRHQLAGIGVVESWVELTDVALPLVSFRWTYRFERDGVELTSDSTLRFREREEIEAALASSGYTVDEVRDAPDRPGLELVFVARAG